jgi:1,2-diacylglycerol 3-alpha-glucosyltransferase
MNVVLVHTDLRLYWPVRLKALSESFRNDNIRLDIIEIAGQGSPYLFDTHTFPVNNNWNILFPEKRIEDLASGSIKNALFKKFNELDPDIIISGPIAFYSGALCASWATRKKKKLIIFDDARKIDFKRPWWVDLIKKKIYSCVDAVFCPAPEWITTYKYFGFSTEQVFFGVDVIDNNFWEKQTQHPEVIKPDILPGKYFLSVGRQVPKKNFMFLLSSYLRYHGKSENPLKLVLVGEGPESERIKEFISANSLSEDVCLLPFLPPEGLRPVYQNAEWFILPSKYGETWGLVVNEAMAAGLPVLVSDQAGCAEVLVKEGVNGFLFSPEKENDLAELLEKVAGISETVRKSFCINSEEIISGWGLERFCRGMSEAIRYVTSTSNVRPDLISRILIYMWKGRYRPT